MLLMFAYKQKDTDIKEKVVTVGFLAGKEFLLKTVRLNRINK